MVAWTRFEMFQVLGTAPGSPPVHLAVTLVIDKGTAPRTPVSDVLIPK